MAEVAEQYDRNFLEIGIGWVVYKTQIQVAFTKPQIQVAFTECGLGRC